MTQSPLVSNVLGKCAFFIALTSGLPFPNPAEAQTEQEYCRFQIGSQEVALSASGGYKDAPLFNERPTAASSTGEIFILDPLAQTILVGRPNKHSCAVSVFAHGADLRAITFFNNQLFGITSDGKVKAIAEDASPAVHRKPGEASSAIPKENLDAARSLLLTTSPLLSDHRALWPHKKQKTIKPGELAKSEAENRRLVNETLVQVGSSKYVYSALPITTNSAVVTVYDKQDTSVKVWSGLVSVPHFLGAVDVFAYRTDQSLYAASEDFRLSEKGQIVVDLVIERRGKDSKLISSGKLNYEEVAASGAAPLANSPIFVDETHVSVPLLHAGYLPFEIIALKANAGEGAENSETEWKKAVVSEHQSQVLSRADAFLTGSWTVQPANLNDNAPDQCAPPGAVWTRPAFLRHASVGDTVYGVPYKWNGKASQASIMTELRAGAIAGNICCRMYKDSKTGRLLPTELAGSTGVDCSGFVARAWNLLDKHGHEAEIGTDELASHFQHRSDLTQLLPGDALDLPGSHVRLFVGWVTTDRGRLIRSYESTASNLCSGACIRDLPVRMYEAYQPIASP
jgi:hypothetical protein